MALGTYNIPKEFRDEDKWFKFFTKIQLVYMFIAAVIAFVIMNLFVFLHLVYIGIFLSVVVFLIALVMAFVPIPTQRYMFGGGYRVSRIVGRLAWKFVLGHGKDIYVKNYKPELEDK